MEFLPKVGDGINRVKVSLTSEQLKEMQEQTAPSMDFFDSLLFNCAHQYIQSQSQSQSQSQVAS